MEYEVFRGGSLERFDEWLALQHVAGLAIADSMPHRSVSEVDQLIHRDDLNEFVDARFDPQRDVESGRLYPNQTVYSPRVVVARGGDERYKKIVGYGLAHLNVSGSERAQSVKRALMRKSYLNVREVFVDPEFAGQGVGSNLLDRLLLGTFPLRKVSAYIWPDETPQIQETLEALGFEYTGYDDLAGEMEVFPGETTRMHRMEAGSVKAVRNQLRTIREYKTLAGLSGGIG